MYSPTWTIDVVVLIFRLQTHDGLICARNEQIVSYLYLGQLQLSIGSSDVSQLYKERTVVAQRTTPCQNKRTDELVVDGCISFLVAV